MFNHFFVQVRSSLRTHLAALQPVEVVLPRGPHKAVGLVGSLGCGLDTTTSRVLQVCVYVFVFVYSCVCLCGCVGVWG
jgi:hypothetical protein